MTPEEREEIIKIINKMIELYMNELDYDLIPPIKIEVRELRQDYTLGESIIIDQIKEYETDKTK